MRLPGTTAPARGACQHQRLRAVPGLLAARGLPTKLDAVAPADIVPYLARDKKRTGERVPFVLIEAPGEVTPGHEVDPASVRAALEELG